ncbi:hypothetical protein BJX76DRAFT_354003 [Aspergillus varians]
MPLKRLSHDAYRVAWICPLEVEQIAAMEMLDREHQPLPQLRGDTNIYNLGSINNHNVVIAGLPKTGNCSAATVVAQMRMTFPNLKYGLLVGIGGGVPVETDSGMIRLGHVVVSEPTGLHSGAVQYDHGKAMAGHFEHKGALVPPPTALVNAARELAVSRQRADVDPIWENTQRIQSSRPALRRFGFPGAANDRLYRSDYEHQRNRIPCEVAGCDPTQRIERQINANDNSFVVVHRGVIASGEMVIKDAKKRDELAQEHGVLCFEMEAAGTLTDFPCMVIRGISDYCDSHKNDLWHGYAAAVAAAYARQLFFHMSIEDTQSNPNSMPINFELPFNISEIPEVTRFVAREDELIQMQEILTGNVGRRTAIVHGLGGIGKTQLATAYVKGHPTDYSARLWLNAKDETTLQESFRRVAEWIFRHEPSITYIASALESHDLDLTVKAVKQWLDEPMNDRWLVVYDNYDSPLLNNRKGGNPSDASCIMPGGYGEEAEDCARAFDLRTYLPDTDHGSIIVTTRSSMVKLGQSIQVGKLLDINDCLEILTSNSGRGGITQDPAAIDLARRLDGLPLALATAGAYLEEVSMTYTEYLQLYNESWRQLHKETPQLLAYDRTLYSTWNISYGYIQQRSPIAAMLLRQWAYFAKEDLWYELLKDGGPNKPTWLQELTDNKVTFHATLRVLCSHGLVETDPSTGFQQVESRGYSVHGCVHSWMIHELNQDINREMALAAAECVAAHVPDQDQHGFWVIQRRLVAHADRCLETMKALEFGYEATNVRHSLGKLYTDQGRIIEAEELYEQALQAPENSDGQDHTLTLNTLNNLAFLYVGDGRLNEAETLFKRSLQGKEKAWGRAHKSTVETINNLGLLYMEEGRLKEAEAMYLRAFHANDTVWGQEHTPKLLTTVYNLGEIYTEQRRYAEAESMYKRVLQGSKQARLREQIPTLDIAIGLCSVYCNQQRWSEAQPIQEHILQEREKAYGWEDTSTLRAVHILAVIYKKLMRFEDAEALFKEALQGYENSLGLVAAATYVPALETLEELAMISIYVGKDSDVIVPPSNDVRTKVRLRRPAPCLELGSFWTRLEKSLVKVLERYLYDYCATWTTKPPSKSKAPIHVVCISDTHNTTPILKVFGSPYMPKHGNWAFQYPRANASLWNEINTPEDTDILITRGLPKGHLALGHMGCRYMRETLWRMGPRLLLHVVGHIHGGYGKEAVFWDSFQRAYEGVLEGDFKWMNLGRMVFHWVVGMVTG